MRKVLLIVNPISGKMSAKSRLFDIINPFCKNGDRVTAALTQRRGDATELAGSAEGYDMIVCAGGDGTLNEVINGMLKTGTNIPLGYIPIGSTNDFACTIGLSKKIDKAAHDVVFGKPWRIDVGKFDERYFSYVASFGVFTRSSYATDQKLKNVFGHFAYILEGVKELVDIKKYNVKITTDGENRSGEYIFAAITNTTSMGGIINLKKKNVKLDDGLFEVILVRHPKTAGELQQTIQAVQTQSFDAPTIDFFNTRELMVDGGKDFNWSLDGEKVTTDGLISISNQPKAIGIIVNNDEKKL